MPIQKQPGKLWFGLAIPASDAETTLGADGTPDGTENPNAKWVGETDAGLITTISKEITEEFVDDYKQPVETSIEQVNGMIKGAIVMKPLDLDVLLMATAGVGTQETVSGAKKIIYGESVITPTCAAVIFPRAEDPTKFGVFMLYSCYNTAPVERPVARQTRMSLPIELKALGVTSRAANDRIGHEWLEDVS